MDNNQITKILTSSKITSPKFLGCFPCDQLPDPNSIKFPASLIVNLDPHQFPGSHWIAIFVYGLDQKTIYFDSLSLPINELVIKSFLNAFPGINFNQIPYQSLSSNSCGHFCICFVYFLSFGLTFTQFIDKLNSFNNPEMFVQIFIRNFPIK